MSNATLYRDADYGALGVMRAPAGIVTIDHGFVAEDFEQVLAVLEQYGKERVQSEGRSLWEKFSVRPEVVLAAVESALKSRGYVADALAAKAILSVTQEAMTSPDLPAPTKMIVNETVERALRRHAEIAWAVLSTLGKTSVSEVQFFQRPNAKDELRRPLPFLRARGFVVAENAANVQRELRETLSALGGALVRATVEVADRAGKGQLAVEFAIAPSTEACDAFLGEALPTFVEAKIDGAREVEFYLKSKLPEATRKFIEEQGAASTAMLALTTRDGRTVTARIPAVREMTDALGDESFRQRLSWVARQLDAYEATIVDVGSVVEIVAPARAGEALVAAEGVSEDRQVYGSGTPAGNMAGGRPVTASELKTLENLLNSLFKKAGLDIAFTNHFLDRVNDPRNGKQITTVELAKVFKEVYAKFAREIKAHGADWEALIKDVTTAINIPFVLSYDRNTGEMDMVAKTVMRKRDFLTRDQKLVVATEARVAEAAGQTVSSNSRLWREVFAKATGGTVWTLSNNFSGEPIEKGGHPDLDYIRNKLPAEAKDGGKLVSMGGGKFRVRFHSNYWIELTAPGLAESRRKVVELHTYGDSEPHADECEDAACEVGCGGAGKTMDDDAAGMRPHGGPQGGMDDRSERSR